MTLNLQQQAARRMRRLVVGLVVAVVVLAAVIVGLVATGSSSGNTAPQGGGPQSPGPSQTPSSAPTLDDDGAGYVAPENWVKLPDGTEKANGLPVKFPHTEQGAVSMMVASSRNSFSWDAKQVETGIRTYVVKEYRDKMASAAPQGAQGVRDHIGLPSGGKIPEGATLNAWPVGVQWKADSADSVQGFVLVRLTSTTAAGQKPKTEFVSLPSKAVWEEGDWRITPTPPGDTPQAPQPADFGTAAFNSRGWTAIQEGDRR